MIDRLCAEEKSSSEFWWKCRLSKKTELQGILGASRHPRRHAPTFDLEFALLFITGPSRYFCVVCGANSVSSYLMAHVLHYPPPRSHSSIPLICSASQPLSSQHVLGVDGVHDEKRPPGAPTRSLLHELDRNLNLLEVDHEQPTAHVHGINDAEFGARKDEYLRLRRFVLKDRVPHNVDTPLHLNVQDCA